MNDSATPELSVAIPLFRERDNIAVLLKQLTTVLDQCGRTWEIVFVDDGSDDDQWSLIVAAATADRRIRGWRLARNFGVQAAATAALQATRGRVVILMDGDLQDPPELIPRLLAHHQDGAEVVVTTKISRQENWLRRLLFRGFYALFRLVGEVPLGNAGLFSLMDRKVVDALLAMPERVRFVPGLRAWTGFIRVEVEFARAGRNAGRAQGFFRLARMALDALLAFSKVPLRLAVLFGLLLAGVGFVAILWIVYQKLFDPAMLRGWSSVLATTILVGGVQLVFLGIVAEYLGRIYDEVKGRPLFIVSERLGEPDRPPFDPQR